MDIALLMLFVLSLQFQCGSGARAELGNPHGRHHGHSSHYTTMTLTDPSTTEINMLRGMLHVEKGKPLGVGKDVKSRDPDRERKQHDPDQRYTQLVFKSAWKVSNTRALETYQKTVKGLVAQNKKIPPMNPPLDSGAVPVPGGSPGEFLMWHGQDAKYLRPTVSKGSIPGEGAFGKGIYFADSASKFDQYVMPDHNGYLRNMLIEVGRENQAPEGNYILFGLVYRTYLGLYAEVQRRGYRNSDPWYWADPGTGNKTFNGKMPSQADSTRAVATKKKHIVDHNVGSLRPVWFNEYVVPSADRAAVEYIVVYERQLADGTVFHHNPPVSTD